MTPKGTGAGAEWGTFLGTHGGFCRGMGMQWGFNVMLIGF